MSTENNIYEEPHYVQPDDGASCYQQALPEMGPTWPKSYPSPPDYVQVIQEVQPANVANSPPDHINNHNNRFSSKPAEIPFQGPTHPKEVVVPFQQPTNNQEMFHYPSPNPQSLTPQSFEPTATKMTLPQPTMVNGMMLPPPSYTQNFPAPGTAFFTAQPMVVTTQTTMIAAQTPYYRDYLPWSIFNLICCCFICGTVALIFSIQTRSAKRYQDWEAAKRKSCIALAFNLTALLVGIAFIVIVPSVYYTQYYTYTCYYGYYTYTCYG